MSRQIKKWGLLALLPLWACSAYDYHVGKFEEGLHWDIAATRSYSQFLERTPQDARAAEIHVRLADIEAREFHRCPEAQENYEAAIRCFPNQKKWGDQAKQGLLNCPDYFPLHPKALWIYGDSASRGQNMRLIWKTLSSGNQNDNAIKSVLYAGKNRIKNQETRYQKKDWGIFLMDQNKETPLLKYPFQRGNSWTTPAGLNQRFFTIESDSAAARTAAGVFAHCLKVKESYGRFPGSWKYSYYAPFVGLVKTTIAGPGYESPNTELLRYRFKN